MMLLDGESDSEGKGDQECTLPFRQGSMKVQSVMPETIFSNILIV